MNEKQQEDFLHTEAFQWCERPQEKEITKPEVFIFGLVLGMITTIALQMFAAWH